MLNKKESVQRTMWLVTLSLIPAGLAGVFIFGIKALWSIALSITAAVLTEYILQKLTKRKIAIYDGSAVLTGSTIH